MVAAATSVDKSGGSPLPRPCPPDRVATHVETDHHDAQDEWLDVSSDEEATDEPERALELDAPTAASVFVCEGEEAASERPDEAATLHSPLLRHSPSPLTSSTMISPQSPVPAHQAAHAASPSASSPTSQEEARSKPRLSDDTAILHAFLNRVAANKKTPTPTAKRESLSNRRDSDVVRQALASPAKPDVLGDLDPNSTSPRKPLVAVAPEELDTSNEASPQDVADPPEMPLESSESSEPKPVRRSVRSRNQVTPLAAIRISPSRHGKGPSKIMIRSVSTPAVVKRTEAQELATVTRVNTRKNKGGSVMPVLRLCKLASEAASPELFTDQTSPPGQTRDHVKVVRWDTTLAYFQEFGDEPHTSQVDKDDPGADTTDAPEAASSTENSEEPKASRRQRASTKAGSASVQTAEEQPPVSVPETPKATTQPPKKRRSRIATPAKGLLTAAALLPADVVIPPAPATGTAAPTRKTKKTSIAAPPLHPPPFNISPETTADSSHEVPAAGTDAVATAMSAPTGKENSQAAATPTKKLPTATTFSASLPATRAPAAHMPRLDFSASRSSTESESLVPGLASPAKKRPKSRVAGAVRGIPMKTATGAAAAKEKVAGAGRAELPGLMSPAKKRVRSTTSAATATSLNRAS